MIKNVKNYCDFEPVQPGIETARILVVDSLIHSVEDFSEVAHQDPKFNAQEWVNEERTIAGLAMGNIVQNVKKLIKRPDMRVAHLSEVTHQFLKEFDPDAIILSGTLRDFDYYSNHLISQLSSILTTTTIPVLGICGGHQMVGQAFGIPITTLDGLLPKAKREDRLREYEYHFVKIIYPEDPIFADILTYDERRRGKGNTIWVWQNHGLMLPGIPEGFTLLGKGYLCRNQMMVKRGDGQLIYTVQFHLEKSFEDWRKTPSRWEHHNESRDGRKLFANFLIEALKHRGAISYHAQCA